jgi:hypothetical protein
MNIQPSEALKTPISMMFEDLEFMDLEAKYLKPKEKPEGPAKHK